MSDRTARVLRIQVSITDDRGHTKTYWCHPVKQHDRGPDVLRAYRLTQRIAMPDEESCGRFKWVNADKPYHVQLLTTGSVTCSCPGFEGHKHCKHVSSLIAGGFIDQDLILDVQKERLELASLREQLEREQLAARREHDDFASLLLAVKQAANDAQAEEQARKAKPRKPRPRRQKPALVGVES
jgi:hypothetical protein